MNFTQQQAVQVVTSYFKSTHWLEFNEILARGEEVRHAHIYLDSCLAPAEIGAIIEEFYAKRGIPVQREIKLLPISYNMLNVYNIMPKGMCHFEFFLRYNPNVILAPMPDRFSREHTSASYWDDAFMENYYKQYVFHPITPMAEKQIKEYFWGDDFRYCYRMMIDEYRGLIHTHGLIETCHHPEELMPYALESFREMGVQVQKSVSVVFNCAGKEMPKMVFLLGAPETSVEIEWHYNPRAAVKVTDPRFFRIADARMMTEYLAARERLVLTDESIAQVLAQL